MQPLQALLLPLVYRIADALPPASERSVDSKLSHIIREIVMDRRVHCITRFHCEEATSHCDLCQWSGPFGQLQAHLDASCQFVATACPFVAGVGLRSRGASEAIYEHVPTATGGAPQGALAQAAGEAADEPGV